MADITLYGRKTSVNVQKAVWVLEELRVPYAQIEVGLNFGGVDTPEYLAMNPNGLVPTLKDGELVLWESHAIVRYLSATYGAGNLWPESPKVARRGRPMDRLDGDALPAGLGRGVFGGRAYQAGGPQQEGHRRRDEGRRALLRHPRRATAQDAVCWPASG